MLNKIFLFFARLLGNSSSEVALSDDEIFFWEEDYLSIEFLPIENFDFLLKENERIMKFGDENRADIGFHEMTEINEVQVKTKSLKVLPEQIAEKLKINGLKEYKKIKYYGGIGEPESIENSSTKAIGKHKTAIYFDIEDGFVNHIWLISNDWEKADSTEIINGLYELGISYNLLLVDYGHDIVDLKNKLEIKEFFEIYKE